MKEYEIWIASTFSEEYMPPSAFSPQMIGKETAISFQIACFKHELKTVLQSVEEQEKKGHVDKQSLNWFYDPNTNSVAWLGKFYETREEAQKYLDNYFKNTQ